jgi:hypothetical protein
LKLAPGKVEVSATHCLAKQRAKVHAAS